MTNVAQRKASLTSGALDVLLLCCSPFAWLGTWVRLYLHALWVSRVSVASLIVALILFTTLPQAQDLFIEFKWTPPKYLGLHWGVVHWTWFYLLAFCLWIVPVYFSARLALQTNVGRMGIDTHAKYRAIVVFLPRILGVLCFIAITIGIYGAYRNLPAAQAEEPILNAAKLQLKWVLWSSVCFNVGLILLFNVLPSLPVLKRLHRVLPPIYQALRWLLDWLSQPAHRVIHRPAPPPTAPPFVSFDEAIIHRNILISVAFWLIIIWIINILIVAISPGAAVDILPRANLVPIILGTLVPGLTFLAVLSHRLRHPCILYFLIVLVVLTSLTPTWHDVKCVPDGRDPKRCAVVGEPRQITLAQAVDAWKTANHCLNARCPKPIIVATEGGASRAAFVTGSALAYLEEQSTVGANRARFSTRLFAVSSVSGGGLGAAVFIGAVDAQRAQKLRQEDPWPRDWLKPWQCSWFGCYYQIEPTLRGQIGPLTRAVQQVIGADFLTPVMLALTFHDVWRFERFGMKSRAAVLEASWQDRFEDIVGTDFLERPLSSVAPSVVANVASSVASGGEPPWRPIMVFNGTSVATGRRIITSSLTSKDIFSHAIDFYALMCERDPPPKGVVTDCTCQTRRADVKEPSCDISVATAILNSARFPLVSPPGNIKSPPGNALKGKTELVHLVVDGGYFENSGTLTALELADALKALKLDPFVLQITNDPESFVEDCEKQPATDYPDVRRPLGILRDPIDTILNSRVARGYHATVAVKRSLPGSYAHIRVCPEEEGEIGKVADPSSPTAGLGGKYKQLSYSWWLSMPVQQYLHNQLASAKNKKSFEVVLQTLEHK